MLLQDKEGFRTQYERNAVILCPINFIASMLMQVEGLFYVNEHLKRLMYEELKHHSASQGINSLRSLMG